METIIDESDDEIQFLSKTVANSFSGEDLCERAGIERRNGYQSPSIPLNEFNNGFIDQMLLKDHKTSDSVDYEIESILQSVMDFKMDMESNYSSEDTDEDCIELIEDTTDRSKWTSNVFLRPNRDHQYFECDFKIDFDEYLDQCLKYCVTNPPVPYDSVQMAFLFYKSFLERLKRLDCKKVNLEMHLWPAISKGLSICCVSGQKSGKTTSYLMPLMNWFDSKEVQHKRDEVKLGAIIICSSTRQTYEIARLAKQWRDPDMKLNRGPEVRIVSLNSSNETKQLTAILNGCDILVSTPEPLLRGINRHIIDCSSTRCLVVDEADVSLALHRKAIQEIYIAFALIRQQTDEKEIKRNGINAKLMAFQTLVFAEKWTKEVQWFAKEVQHMPVVMFGSFYEASIAFRIDCKVKVVSEDQREKSVITLVRNAFNDNHKWIAIVFRSVKEISFFKRILSKCLPKIHFIEVTEETPHYELEAKASQWHRGGSVLLINDSAIKSVPGFKSCDCIIHYRLPFVFNEVFGQRFLLMRDRLKKYKNPFDAQNTQKLLNYIVVSPIETEQMVEILHYLKRLNISIPDQLRHVNQKHGQQLCRYFSAYGECPFTTFQCFDRHCVNDCDLPNPSVPESGQIKIAVTYVSGANQLFFRINEFRGERETTGKWKKMDKTFEDIKEELNSLKNTDFNTIHTFSNEEIYGIAIRGQVFRVRLTQIFGFEELYSYEEYDANDKSQRIELFCIDFGHKVRSLSRQLFNLPKHLRDLPPFAFKGYIFGIKPIDNEMEWDFTSTQRFYELVDNYRVTQTTAWILKQIDGVFWINRLKVETKLKNTKLSLDSNPIEYLIAHKLVDRNHKKMNHFNTDYNKIVNIWQNSRLSGTAYNSCLVDNTSYVVISHFVSVREFYLIHENRVRILDELERKWTSDLSSLKPLPEVVGQQICFYKHLDCDPECCVNRAKVVAINSVSVDLFLVDHGETVANVPKNTLLQIQESHLKELPFQAIKVSLFGFEPSNPVSVTPDMIYDLTRDESERYSMVIAIKAENKENDSKCVRIFVSQNIFETEFMALSQILVDKSCGHYIDGEDDNDLVITVEKEPTDYEESEQFSEEYLTQLEERFVDKMTKEVILQEFDLKEDEDIDDKPVVNPKESRVAKTMRRLKAIKANTLRQQNTDSESEEEGECSANRHIDYTPEDFVYTYDPNDELAYYDKGDDSESMASDEDAIFDDEDIS